MQRLSIFRLGIMVFLAVFALAACGPQPEPFPSSNLPQAGESQPVAETGFDYCNLPAGTHMTWFDFSAFNFVPAGSFQMGFDSTEDVDYKPVHPASLNAFWIHETEVTNRQYANCVAAGICQPPVRSMEFPDWYDQPEHQDDPLVGVTWDQADQYCQWIGARLPTEAEWELAARGLQAFLYPWGNDDPECRFANYSGCLYPNPAEPVWAGYLVEGKSPFDALDLTGNVNEWVQDWYSADYYQTAPAGNPQGPETGEQRVVRGGGYLTPIDQLQAYLRSALTPDASQSDLGFRCALDCGSSAPPRVCQLPPAVGDLPLSGAEVPRIEVVGEAYCETRASGQVAGVVLSSPSGLDLGQYEVTSPAGNISCELSGEQLVCYGPAVQPNSTLTISLCPDCAPGYFFDPLLGFCRPMLFEVGQLPQERLTEDCDPGFIRIEGYGCISVDPVSVSCPPGYYYSEGCGCVPDGTICALLAEPTPVVGLVEEPTPVVGVVEVPTPVVGVVEDPSQTGSMEDPSQTGSMEDTSEVGLVTDPNAPREKPFPFEFPNLLPEFPLRPGRLAADSSLLPLPDEPQECYQGLPLEGCPPNSFPWFWDGCLTCFPMFTNPACPAGYTYDGAAGCCTPNQPVLTCPWFYMYDPATHSCVPIQWGDHCTEISVYVPACAPPVQLSCKNPSQYTDRTACEAANCVWRRVNTAAAVIYSCQMP
jgi:hypothetical protein